MKTLALAAAAALSIGSAYAAQPTVAGHGSGGPAKFVTPKKGSVLVNQTTGGSSIGIVSQNFEAEYATYDSADADAFTVPKGKKWSVTEVVANGQYFNGSGPATSEDVTFYKSTKGAPGKAVKGCNYSMVVGQDSSGAFTIKLPKACKLKAGTYWVSVVANLAFGAGGEWGWNDAAETGTLQADWENPQGGFGIGCTTWGVETSCIADGQANGKDYELIGTD